MSSYKEDIEKLLINHNRRLQALEERKALYGLETPIAILTEIEDEKVEIEKLQKEWDVVSAIPNDALEESKKLWKADDINQWIETDDDNIRIGLSCPTDKVIVHHTPILSYGKVVGISSNTDLVIVGYVITDREYEQESSDIDKSGYWKINAIHLGASKHRLFFRIFDETDKVIATSKKIIVFKR